jgi:type IV pilus assembly protein PilP
MIKRVIPLVLVAVAAAGCSSKDTELKRFIAQTKQEPAGGVEPLPEVKPYDSFKYDPGTMRSPFMPGSGSESSAASVRPNIKRNREFLEQFSIDTLKMVGTLAIGGKSYGLVKTREGLVQRVQPGNYVGQSDGRITKIEPSKISITEIVPDGLGGFMERGTALTLNE